MQAFWTWINPQVRKNISYGLVELIIFDKITDQLWLLSWYKKIPVVEHSLKCFLKTFLEFIYYFIH